LLVEQRYEDDDDDDDDHFIDHPLNVTSHLTLFLTPQLSHPHLWGSSRKALWTMSLMNGVINFRPKCIKKEAILNFFVILGLFCAE